MKSTTLQLVSFLGGIVSLWACHHTHHSHLNGSHSHEIQPSVPNYLGAYTLSDEKFGTKTVVTLSGDKRKMVTNALPNHKTGEFPNPGNPNTISAQNMTYTFPLNPVYTGQVKWVKEPGVALNGVKFDPGTNEVITCQSGENYRIEAIQNIFSLGLDDNHAHVQPGGAYHYHGAPTGAIAAFDKGEDLVHIGFAKDGFPIYYSKSGAYKSSYQLIDDTRTGTDCVYPTPRKTNNIKVQGDKKDGTYTSDWEYAKGKGDLDECNGVEIKGKYAYIATKEYPYIGRCLMGEYEEERRGPQGGGPPNGRPQGGEPQGGGPQGGGPPTFEKLLTDMDKDKDGKLAKSEAKGPILNNFSKIDTNSDGFISAEEFKNAPPPPPRGRN